jgi:hypothetical protein
MQKNHYIPKKSYRKSVHGDESGGSGDRFNWFEGSLYKSFQGPLGCYPLYARAHSAAIPSMPQPLGCY